MFLSSSSKTKHRFVRAFIISVSFKLVIVFTVEKWVIDERLLSKFLFKKWTHVYDKGSHNLIYPDEPAPVDFSHHFRHLALLLLRNAAHKPLKGVILLSCWIRLQLLLSVYCIYPPAGASGTSSPTWIVVISEVSEWFDLNWLNSVFIPFMMDGNETMPANISVSVGRVKGSCGWTVSGQVWACVGF